MGKYLLVYLYILEVVGAENYRNYAKMNARDKLPWVDLAWGICLFNAQISDLSTPHLHPPTHPIPPNFFHRWGEICLRRQNHWWKEPGAVGKKMQPSFCSWYLPMGNYGICLHHVLTFQQSTFYSFPIYGTQMNDSENETNNRRNNKKYKVSKNCFMGCWLHNASGFQNKHDET